MSSNTSFEPKMIVFTAPSGSGKTTIVHHLLGKFKDLAFSVSATSRNPRPHEQEGVDYYFVSKDEFKKLIKKQAFAEWEQVYEDQFYGTLKSEITRIWNLGKHVVFDINVKGALAIKNLYKEQCITFFIKTPTLQDLIFRLKKRNTENPHSLMNRIEKASKELQFEPYFDHVIINNVLDEALENAENKLKSQIPNLK